MAKIRVVILDDHSLARALLRHFLSLHPDVEIVSSCEDTASAWSYIETGLIDVIFLDINIFGESDRAGLDLAIRIDRLNLPQSPWIIFTSGYTEYSHKSSDVRQRFGYLLKPIDDVKVSKVLNKVRLERINKSVAIPTTKPLSGILVNCSYRDSGETIRLQRYLIQNEIVYVEANNGHSIVHLAQGLPVSGISEPLKFWENHSELPKLMRIHTKYVVNVDYIDGVKGDSYNAENFSVTFRGSRLELPASANYLQELRIKLNSCLERLSLGKGFV